MIDAMGKSLRRFLPALSILALLAAPALYAAPAGEAVMVAQQAEPAADAKDDDSPETKYRRRFPQPAKVGHLIGLPVLDDNDVTLGHVQKVVRTPEGKIELIVSYSRWFGWFGRPVAVPIEVFTILALQLDSVEMEPEDYEKAPTWMQGQDQTLADEEIVRIALGRR